MNPDQETCTFAGSCLYRSALPPTQRLSIILDEYNPDVIGQSSISDWRRSSSSKRIGVWLRESSFFRRRDDQLSGWLGDGGYLDLLPGKNDDEPATGKPSDHDETNMKIGS
jgi:hypothetical protein